MSREQVYERLTEVFREVFDNEEIVICDTTTSKDVDGWDSYEHINLIVGIEEEFGMKFTMGEVTGMHNVGEMVTLITGRATK